MLKIYASYFVSYLLMNLRSIENIERIILFGSVAKGEPAEESDVDIFIWLKKENKKSKTEIDKVLSDFYESREASLFKLKRIDNKINLITGRLDNWKELEKSIESTGIVLYGKYVSSGIRGKKYSIIFWDKIEKNRGAFLNKIYGFKVKEKKYKGLLEEFKGRKLGKSSIMIPAEYGGDIFKLLRKHKVNSKIIEVYA